MTYLLEATSHYAPEAVAVGVTVFIALLVALGALHSFGQARPHALDEETK